MEREKCTTEKLYRMHKRIQNRAIFLVGLRFVEKYSNMQTLVSRREILYYKSTVMSLIQWAGEWKKPP